MKECRLCKALKNEKHLYLKETDDYVILPTLKKKGHHKRIMILTKDHISYEDLDLEREQKLIKEFIEFCKDYFDEEPTFAIVESTYITIPQHWHKISCDWFATPEELQQLHYTPHQAIQTKVEWKP